MATVDVKPPECIFADLQRLQQHLQCDHRQPPAKKRQPVTRQHQRVPNGRAGAREISPTRRPSNHSPMRSFISPRLCNESDVGRPVGSHFRCTLSKNNHNVQSGHEPTVWKVDLRDWRWIAIHVAASTTNEPTLALFDTKYALLLHIDVSAPTLDPLQVTATCEPAEKQASAAVTEPSSGAGLPR